MITDYTKRRFFYSPVKPGTGAQLDWTGITVAGSYTIVATNPSNGQSATMNGMFTGSLDPLPQIYLMTAQNAEHCAPVTPFVSRGRE